MPGVAAPEIGGGHTDLPAVKPAAKPAVPWGSLTPPSTESKAPPPPRVPAAGLPKGAMGVPNTPPLAAAAAVMTQKSVTTASAFGSGSAKQTMVGHARSPAQEVAINNPAPVFAPVAKPSPPPEPIASKDAGALPFVDLPAPKSAARPFANMNAKTPARSSEPPIDLPALKPQAAGPKFGGPVAKAPPMVDIDLPERKVAAPQAPLKAAAPEAPMVDLPAPKLSVPKIPFAPAQPKAATPEAPMVDLPAPKLAAPKPLFAPPPPKAAAPEAPMIDLPAPKLVGAKPQFAPPPPPPPKAAIADVPMIDLPAPKLSAPKPPFAPPPKAAVPEPPMFDLPPPKAAPPRPPIAAKAEPPSIDLPALKQTDLPALKQPANTDAGFGEIDLPTPKGRVDLPALKTSPAQFGEVDLPAPKNITDLPAPVGIADLPAPRGVMDLPTAKGAGFGELDLPIPKAFSNPGEVEASFGDLELPDGLGGRSRSGSGSFGDIELPPPRAGADLVPPKAATYLGVGRLPQSRVEDESSFGDLEIGSPIPPYPDDDDMRLDDLRSDDLVRLKHDPNSQSMDLGSLPPALRGGDGDSYGEAGLEGGADDSMEFGIAEGEGEGFALPPEILRRQRGEEDTTAVDRGKRALHVLIGAGAALGFTDYGFFGIYVLEQYLPEAANPRFAREAIERAEKSAADDSYKGVRRSLVALGEARHQAGLNRELLTRSLLHEALYLVRFGADTSSSAHVAAILRRLEERHGLAPGMALARAGDAARRGDYPEAQARIAEALEQTPNDAYAHLLAGEVALHQGKLSEAEKAFGQARKYGGAARAQWGLARVALMRPDEAAQRAAVEQTLKLSPFHAEARIAEARLLFKQGKEERAVQELRQALGQEPLDDQFLQTSKLAKAQGYSLLGHIHEQRGRLHLARKAYEDAVSADPYLVEALLGSGRVMLREHRFNDALARFESGLNIAQKTPGGTVLTGRKAEVEARLGQSRAELALGRAPDAKANLTALLKDSPNDSEVTLAMGQAEEAIGNKESAENLFRKAIELAPETFAGYLALSQYYFKQSQPDRASETLNDAATKVAETAEMRRMLGQSELARNRLDSAMHEFKRAIELDSQDLDARFGLAVSYRRAGNLSEAQALFDAIAVRDPQYAGLTLERGQLLEAQGLYDKAVENYRAALARDTKDTSLMLRLGAAQVESGQLDAADQTLDKVIHDTPNSADAEYYIGRVAFARGRGPDALTHFDRSLALDGTQPAYHLYAARAALEMNNLGRTVDEAEATLDRDPKSGDAFWVRGVVRLRSGAVKDALKDGARALELNPKRIEAQALMAECYDELRQLPQAVAAYQLALAADGTRGEWWYKLGRVYIDQGTRGQGAEALEKAIKLGDPIDPPPYWLADSYRLLGDLARASNNRKAAVTAYKRYLQLSPPGALDRADVTKVLRGWNVELEE
jgi:tetratricopeptide (TPR) repeat protein